MVHSLARPIYSPFTLDRPVLILAEQTAGDDKTNLTEGIAQEIVDAIKPTILAALPEITNKMVDEAIPRFKQEIPGLMSVATAHLQEEMKKLQPQLTEMALASAHEVLADEQVHREVAAKTKEIRDNIRNGFIASTATIVAAIIFATWYSKRGSLGNDQDRLIN